MSKKKEGVRSNEEEEVKNWGREEGDRGKVERIKGREERDWGWVEGVFLFLVVFFFFLVFLFFFCFWFYGYWFFCMVFGGVWNGVGIKVKRVLNWP